MAPCGYGIICKESSGYSYIWRGKHSGGEGGGWGVAGNEALPCHANDLLFILTAFGN